MASDEERSEPTNEDPTFRELLDFVRDARGVDLTAFKEGTLRRRIDKRRQEVGAEDLEAYRRYVEEHPDELPHLFDTVLINVTSFFRDPEAWRHLAEEILPRILDGIPPDGEIRVWTAGCSSGEETYTILMVLAEALGLEETTERVHVYATDIDEDALAKARSATYTAEDLEAVPAPLRETYFTRRNAHFLFRKDLRAKVVFGRHDLLQDPPMSRIDLLVCRNTLMYFTPDAQARILSRFHFALDDEGALFLGRAEMLLTRSDLFLPIDRHHRVFQKTSADRATRERLLARAQTATPADEPEERPRLGEAAFDLSPVPHLVVDRDGRLALANRAAVQAFDLNRKDLDRPFSELRLSYHPAELRSAIERAYEERGSVRLPDVQFTAGPEDVRLLRIQVDPILDSGRALGALVTFEDVTTLRRFDEELEHLRREREAAYEDLQASNEELETTNEELQASNEELETTNEELQSTNEELETMNEELQSTNAELEAINTELQSRTEAHDRVNIFLHAILSGLSVGVVVLDPELRVTVWNPHAQDQWGVRSDEVEGRSLADLDINLPVDDLLPRLRSILSGELAEHQATIEATNRRGRPISCRMVATPLSADQSPEGVILWLEDTPR